MNWTPDDWARLGARIRSERESRGVSREKISEIAETSPRTIQNAEEGRVPSRWPSTFTRIERALGWAPGSMKAILDGGEPDQATTGSAEPAEATTQAFAAWLRDARTREGISQQQVAASLNVEGLTVYQQTIAKIETGERADIPLALAVALTRMFGTTLDAALGLRGEQQDDGVERVARRTALLQRLRDQIDAELSA